MRYRWKMLFVLLVIAMVPIIVIRTVGVNSVRHLANELVSRAQQEHIDGVRRQMRMLVTSYASVLWAAREKIEMALLMQAREVERCLAKRVPAPPRGYFSADFNSGIDLPGDTTQSSFHFRSRSEERIELLKVSLSQQVFKLAPGVSRGEVAEDISRLYTMTPMYKSIYDRLRSMIYWQYTSLANGLHSAYPGHNAIPRRLDPREQLWYRAAVEKEASWTDPYVDPETRQIVIAATTSIKRPSGKVAGVTSLIVPVSSLFDRRVLFQNIPPETGTLLIYLSPRAETGLKGARIYARDEHIEFKHRFWRAQMGSDWLVSSDKKQFQAMLNDLENGVSQVRRMPYQGKDSLWVYGAVPSQAFLVLITPYEQILRPARQAKQYVEGRIENLLGAAKLGIYGTVLLVVFLAFSFSRTVTKPIRSLAEGAKHLAEGRFDFRVDIRSRDEFGDMGQVFNSVGPRLKELYQMRHSLALAMEVQQNLLPVHDPHVRGFDIAGKSIYCDETGGDYYDFLTTDGSRQDKISIVVGDVCDHGIPSALLMTTARAFLRQRASLTGSIKHIVSDVNLQLARDVQVSGRFMTLFYAEIDSREKYIRWVRAGHDPALFYDPAADTFSELAGKGLPLGVFEDTEYEECRHGIAPGQVIVISTDGIWEIYSPQGQMFGKEALKQIIRTEANKSAKEILSALIDSALKFRAPLTPKDDITLVVIKIRAANESGQQL